MTDFADWRSRLPALRSTLARASGSTDPTVCRLRADIDQALLRIDFETVALPGHDEEWADLRVVIGWTAALHQALRVEQERAAAAAHVSAVQRKRRKDKPASDPTDTGRNGRMRKMYKRLVADGSASPMSDLAVAFEVSTRTASRVINGK